jgi:UDP-N-acetylmuramyl pentapeptide phosphotransferase/UDP-N-acetylglucosamine-1-phosphate transferase
MPVPLLHTHVGSISRFGGLARALCFVVMAGIAFAFFPVAASRTHERWVVLVSALAMFGLGFVDDAWPLGAKRKL